MTLKAAIRHARSVAHKTKEPQFVVWSPEPLDIEREHYHVADALELDTYFSGCNDPVYCTEDSL